MDSRQRMLWAALLGTLVWGIGMTIEVARFDSQTGSPPRSCAYFAGKPVLDLELPRSATCFREIILQGAPQTNIATMRLNTYMDFVFIVLYWAVFALFARLYRNSWSKWVIALASVAAIFDFMENFRIIALLGELERSSASLPGILPFPFAFVKWASFGAALFFVGMLVRPMAGKTEAEASGATYDRALSRVLRVTSPLILIGLFIANVLVAATALFALTMLFAVFRYSPFQLSVEKLLSIIAYAYLLRFQIIAALLLAVALPLGYRSIPSIFAGLFDAGGRVSFVLIIWLALQLAWAVMVNSRMVVVYGPERFESLQPIGLHPVGIRTVLLFGLLAVPSIGVLWKGSADLGSLEKTLGTVAGVAAAVGMMFLIAAFHFSIEEASGSTAKLVFPSFGFLKSKMHASNRTAIVRAADSQLSNLPPALTRGYLRNMHLRSGHRLAITALLMLFVVYGLIGIAYSPSRFSPEHQPAAMFYLLFLITLCTWFFSGAAFFLDRLRLPVFTTVLVLSLVTALYRTDHQFAVTGRGGKPAEEVSPKDVIEHWAQARGKQGKVATIIATAGGGIRAAAWTAEVATRLQESCGEKFSSSLVLVSSVSGGSVGSMFVVAPFDSQSGAYPRDPQALKAVRFDASRSSLSAVGWGLLYIDVARTVPFLGAFVPQTFDRGWALENAWVTGWKQPPNLSDWRRDVTAGTRPAVIFNGTAAENGERFLFASTDTAEKSVIRFSDKFRDWDVPIATAARMSATFPYVSPIASPSEGPGQYRYHVADGGYYDNSGVFSALAWLKEARPVLGGYQILLVLIDAEPGEPQSPRPWSWLGQITGPLETILHVRTSSQQERDRFDLDFAIDSLKKDGLDIKDARFEYPLNAPAPLSWHLTHDELLAIGSAWDKLSNEEKDKALTRLECK